MTLSLQQCWKIHELVVNKHTGGIFAQIVISGSMMKNYTSVQRYMYEDEWMGGRVAEGACLENKSG